MGVPKSDRSISQMEFFKNAIELRKDFVDLLLRDFGVKKRKWNVENFTGSYHFSEEDAGTMKELCEKYEINGLVTEFPEWLIDNERQNILKILNELISNITKANSIYPHHREEYFDRRILQDYAIGNCEELFQEMQYCLDIFPVDANKYMQFVDKINKEIALLKGWRKGDNKILERIKKKEKEEAENEKGNNNKGKSSKKKNKNNDTAAESDSLPVVTDKAD